MIRNRTTTLAVRAVFALRFLLQRRPVLGLRSTARPVGTGDPDLLITNHQEKLGRIAG